MDVSTVMLAAGVRIPSHINWGKSDRQPYLDDYQLN